MAGVAQILKLSGETNEVNFAAEDHLLDFKKKVAAACEVEVCRQRLVLGDKVLKPDSEKIVKLGVQPGSDVTLFIKRFPPPSLKDKAKIQALMEAGDFEGLQQAAEEGYDLSVENGLYDVLHTAASNGDYDMIEMMLETGVSVFAITRQNPKTALQVAAKYGQKKVCELLIEWGLDPHEKNKLTSDGSNRRIESWDAVQYADGCGFPELAAWLAVQPSPKAPMAAVEKAAAEKAAAKKAAAEKAAAGKAAAAKKVAAERAAAEKAAAETSPDAASFVAKVHQRAGEVADCSSAQLGSVANKVLRRMCRGRGLPSRGNRADLLSRLAPDPVA